jgi:hypothetical protein
MQIGTKREIAGPTHQPLNSYWTAAGRPRWSCAQAKVAELADAPDLGSGGETRGGSSPPFRTKGLLADLQQNHRHSESVRSAFSRDGAVSLPRSFLSVDLSKIRNILP